MKKEKKVVVGFWFRLLSDLIDALILGVFGFVLAIPFSDFFYSLGENGLFLGLIITFLYTGILQSHIGNGQSLAKKILKIQVVNMDGSCLSLPKSFFRFAVIALIFYNSWIWTALISLAPFLNNLMAQFVFSGVIAFLFLGVTVLVALHPLKRGIHDLVAGSIVVRRDSFQEDKIQALNDAPKAKRACVIWGSCCAVLLIVAVVIFHQQNASMTFLGELSQLRETISQNTSLKNMSVTHHWSSFKNEDGVETKTTSIRITPFLEKGKFDDVPQRTDQIQKAVNIIAGSYSKLNECDYIQVEIRTGFNIGITSLYVRKSLFFDTKGQLLKSDQ